MFHNNMWPYTQKDKSKTYKMKKLKSHDKAAASKHSRHTKSHKKYKHSKLKCINTVSNFVGPERLTNHVGFFTKGKISDSISRIEKIMPKEVKARAQQDLQEVLKLTSVKSKRKKRRSMRNINISCGSTSSDECFLRNSFESPPNSYKKTRFANKSWKDKFQKSVGVTSVNSVLASVNEPQKTPPVRELRLARKVIMTKINPFIKEANSLLFPDVSTKNKIKRKLQDIKSELVPCTTVNSQEMSSISRSTTVSSNVRTRNSQTPSNVNFHLSPSFTGEYINQGGITKIVPNASEFVKERNNLIPDIDSVNLKNKLYDYDVQISPHAPSSSIGQESSMTFVPTSPTTSSDSPAWKLQLSHEKFVPKLSSTPTLYFQRKMF